MSGHGWSISISIPHQIIKWFFTLTLSLSLSVFCSPSMLCHRSKNIEKKLNERFIWEQQFVIISRSGRDSWKNYYLRIFSSIKFAINHHQCLIITEYYLLLLILSFSNCRESRVKPDQKTDNSQQPEKQRFSPIALDKQNYSWINRNIGNTFRIYVSMRSKQQPRPSYRWLNKDENGK